MNQVLFFCLAVLLEYIFIGLIFYILDKKKLFRKSKIQKDVCLSDKEYFNTVKKSITNIILVIFPIIIITLTVILPWRRKLGPTFTPKNTIQFIILVLLFGPISEIIFHLTHKALHSPWLFKNVHGHHHEIISPVSTSTLDAHPFEIFFQDILPIIVPIYLIGPSINFSIFYTCWNLGISMFAHSGYYIPIINDGHHDLHHERMKCNYGTPNSDGWFGTRIKRERGKVYSKFDKNSKTSDNSRNTFCPIEDQAQSPSD